MGGINRTTAFDVGVYDKERIGLLVMDGIIYLIDLPIWDKGLFRSDPHSLYYVYLCCSDG